jgi:hypothetical protein
MAHRFDLVCMVSVLCASCAASGEPPAAVTPRATTQIAIPRVELMPDEPRGFKLLDFNAIARGYDKVVFDPEGKHASRPLMWWDDSKVNMPARGVGMPSYVDHPEMKSGSNHEAITVLGSILGATMAGIDKSKGEANYAAMSAQYFNSANKSDLVLNRVSTPTGNSYWYELFPQIVFDVIANRYPDQDQLTVISNTAAHKWLDAYDVLSKDGPPSFESISFDFTRMKPVENGKQKEPDAAAGLAQIFFSAYLRTGEQQFLVAADTCLKTIENRPASPSYEILMPFGAYAAARLNAEHDRSHDVGKLLNDYFEPISDVRAGWGLIVGNWNGVEASGLMGSVNDAGGYGFTMNTFATAIGVVPIARYDERYARSIGKWMLNAAGAIRYCYPGQLPLENTTKPDFTSDPPNVIAFEGIRHRYKGKSPLAGGDPTVYGWGPCDLGLYGSGFAGVYGGIIRPTSDPMILQLDLLVADPCPPKALPTFLYFNPHDTAMTIQIDVGTTPVDLYDSLENRAIERSKSGTIELTIPADAARMIVRVPAGSIIVADGRESKVGEIVIDYENGLQPAKPVPVHAPVASKARRVNAPKFTPTIDGKTEDWSGRGATLLGLDTGGRGSLKAAASFAWDDEFLYVLVRETQKGKDAHEAKDVAAFSTTPWDFDAVNLYIDLGNGRRASLGDFVLNLAWESGGQKDVSFSPQAPDDGTAQISSATSGTKEKGDRIIEARIAWKGIASAAFGEGVKPEIAAEMTIGCEPALVEMNHTRQSFIGGSQYQRPTGMDANSTDLVLQDAR